MSQSDIAPHLAATGLWKLYGPADVDLTHHVDAARTTEELKAAGVVGAVRGVELSVRRGEIFVIMGLSGSGKSTLVRLLARLIDPTAGAVTFDGRDLVDLPPRELIEIRRHRMAMVFQNFALLGHLSALGNVAFPLEVRGLPRAERERRAREVLQLVGLEGRENSYPRQLSGGQQQRVGIARALAGDPELLFLDEPFSALDPLIRREMQDEFLRLQAVLKKTIVFITHDFDEAIRLAGRIAIMKDGAIEQIGTPEDLVLRPATPYVAAFTRQVSPSKVRTVASLMRPLPEGGAVPAGYPEVAADAKVADVGPRFRAAPGPFLVTDGDGRPAGVLRRDDVVDVVLGG
ncbi:quaternary amine ABC transporter ATP-binding protein [Oharaeibacter diazotrophicus]|uniref:Quaternary amine transport ATP-binding protein n=1 Tax=Oharaeibacter diazotrophicus TaxID=1920512 RepID=A0A4R6RIS6_9HYPH|nr:betaine/proline/choline family ABC transporter ATP-binding protein [Oharaeibacter diazotrophicus]TDP86292.1 glycine betaine/proline transport system ATP-binding protein [Oharaeibacter diazotrophicus]BBE71765.1 glycine betaine transport ATP-binding protein OpuAA [Pleomorphomonas sp. SM30]GLS78531.1 ABC transporter ATP-binding protein [Oharaeibacter diazotrophicus]